MKGHEVELDAHEHAGRQLSALLSAALAAAQSAAQVAADKARERSRIAEQQAREANRQAELMTREQQRDAQQAEQARRQIELAAQRQAERQARTEESVRHRHWNLKPSSQWLHDNPLSAAAAWASADVHRAEDPVAARHAEQWETIFKKENINVDDIRANAPAAVAAAEQQEAPNPAAAAAEPAELAGELAAAEVASTAVVAGAVDVANALETEREKVAGASAAGSSQWTAYADGAPAAALGGRGVSTPPNHVLAFARENPDLAASTATVAGRQTQLAPPAGIER